ncbi:hypothetical protein ACWCV9_27055 [Streptomyces sp. NPDC001606]
MPCVPDGFVVPLTLALAADGFRPGPSAPGNNEADQAAWTSIDRLRATLSDRPGPVAV